MNRSPQRSPLSALLQYPYLFLGAIVFTVLGSSFLRKHAIGDWDVTYLLSARHLWNGQSIYHNGDGYIYPPFPALFALPFACLSGIFPTLVWYVVTVASFALMCRWAWQLASGPPLQSAEPAGAAEHLAFLLAIIPGATYAFNCISHSQTDILIGFAIIAGCVALSRDRAFAAASLYAFAAAMKGPALIWFAYLIARRKPVAAAWMLIAFLGLNLAPNLVHPADRHSLLLSDWAHDYLLPKKTTNVYPDVWYSESNQSLLGCITRWTTTRWEWIGNTYQQRIPLSSPASPSTVKMLTLGVDGILAFILATALGWWPRKLDVSSPSIRPGLEFSLVAILMLAFSPMAAKAQWGILMLPGFCLARLCIHRRDLTLAIFFAIGWLAWLASQNFLGKNEVFVGLWYGAVLINALAWFAGCAIAILRMRKAAS